MRAVLTSYSAWYNENFDFVQDLMPQKAIYTKKLDGTRLMELIP